MNQTLFYLSFAAFLLLPAIVLFVRFVVGRQFPWWGVAFAIAAGGWLASNAAVHFYFESICEPIWGVSDPPAEALERCTNDGAKRVFALFFGWIYGLVYSIPFMLIFLVASRIRARQQASSAHAT